MSVPYPIEGTVATDADFSRPSYTFLGWTTQPNGTGTAYTPGADLILPCTTDLYAHWEANP